MEALKVGIIGCGFVAERYHLPALRRSPQMKTIALSDLNEKRMLELKEKFNLKHVLTTINYSDILENNDVNAVMVLTPPHVRATIAIEAINAGKHVFCEKPLSLTPEESEEILQALNKKKVKLMVGFNFRFIPHFERMREFVKKKNIIGKPIVATTSFFSPLRSSNSVTGFQFKKEMGGGALFEMGCHHIDLLRWIMGEFEAVQAMIWKSNPSLPVDDNAFVHIKFKNGGVGSVQVGWSVPFLHRFEIFGDEGIVGADLSKSYVELYLEGKSIFKHGAVKIPVGDIMNSYAKELRHFADCIIYNKKPEVTAKDGLQALKIVSRCYESDAKKQMIPVG